MDRGNALKLTRRQMLKYGALSGAAAAVGGKAAWAATCTDQTPTEIHMVQNTGCGMREEMPVSPLVLQPFTDPLPVPKAMKPGWRQVDGTLQPHDASNSWYCRPYHGTPGQFLHPQKTSGCQDSMGERDRPNAGGNALPKGGTHQLWPGTPGTQCESYPDPIYYHIRLQVAEHSFTSSPVQHLSERGVDTYGHVIARSEGSARPLPKSTIYGFNGTFPGPMINAEYGKPVCIRFENDLDVNPNCLDRQDFGAPDWGFLTHLHNGHTAPESDGNPNHLTENEGAYHPGEWCDNLYLMHPAGGDDREKQSFLWFHDHRMHHTGANVYKGMVGLMPHYDPKLDPGDETKGLRLPGKRIDNGDGTFDVDYDIPLALYDCALDDGEVRHRDQHQTGGRCDAEHPEWWGKLFYTHQNNHGFVGDIFTVNCKAYPVLHVKRRKYRLRFLDASIARCYELWLMRGNIAAFPGQQGQWNFATTAAGSTVRTRGQQCMRMTQIAVDGGLLPKAIVRDSMELWPAKRREVVVDFSKYMDGSSTSNGDVIYLSNTMLMLDGRKPEFDWDGNPDPTYCVPMLKIVIDGDAPDNSVMPAHGANLRPMPAYLPTTVRGRPHFKLERGGVGDEGQWVINGLGYDPARPLHKVKLNSAEIWTVENGGGGWTHPMHLHAEEHRVLSRTGGRQEGLHVDDTGREDVIALDPGETVAVYRRFRNFAGKYVAHCHNLAHEDHNMMFGWVVEP
jgi:FtsP/CotA-like multicopper oxidase with cupredoxin domain